MENPNAQTPPVRLEAIVPTQRRNCSIRSAKSPGSNITPFAPNAVTGMFNLLHCLQQPP